MGVKIPRLGYLDPHPVKSAFGKFEDFLFTCEAVLFSIVFEEIFRDLTKPIELCYISCQLKGVGSRYPGYLRYLDPHPVKSAFGKFEDFLFTYEAVLFSIVFDVNI